MSRVPLRVRWDWLRAWIGAGPWLRAAPMAHRCCMGYPLGDLYRCRRRAPGDALWCPKHDPAVAS